MIITTGKVIKIDVNGHIRLERTCETPGAVRVSDRDGNTIALPVNEGERRRFIAAYWRACEEDIPYRKSGCEDALAGTPTGSTADG